MNSSSLPPEEEVFCKPDRHGEKEDEAVVDAWANFCMVSQNIKLQLHTFPPCYQEELVLIRVPRAWLGALSA